MTTTYKIYSAKQQGCFSKDELIATLDEVKYAISFGTLDYQKITSYGINRVYIKKAEKKEDKVNVYSREDCVFMYCDSHNGECELYNKCHHS